MRQFQHGVGSYANEADLLTMSCTPIIQYHMDVRSICSFLVYYNEIKWSQPRCHYERIDVAMKLLCATLIVA